MKKFIVLAVVLVLAVVGVVAMVVARPDKVPQVVDPTPRKPRTPVVQGEEPLVAGKGLRAIEQAAGQDKYLFAFFWKEEDDQTAAMRKTFDAAMKKLAERADSVQIRITDVSEKAIVAKFDLQRAPMPLVLALAPNGAITGGFPTKFEEQELLEAFASPRTEKCMKCLQDSKLVLLCVQNTETKSNEGAMQGVRDFKADARFSQATEIVTLDPADPAEAGFLADLRIPPDTEEAVTVFLAPPGMPIAMFEGATQKDQLINVLNQAGSCGPGGCGPGGCGPGGCGPNGCGPRQ